MYQALVTPVTSEIRKSLVLPGDARVDAVFSPVHTGSV